MADFENSKDEDQKKRQKRKKKTKKIIKMILPFLPILIAGLFVLGVMYAVANFLSGFFNVFDFSNLITSTYNDGGISDQNIEDSLKQIQKQLKDKGITLQEMGMSSGKEATPEEEEQSEFYLKEFLTASLVTEIVDSNSNNPNVTPGGVILQRHNAKTNQITKLHYSDKLAPDTFILDKSGNIQYLNADNTTATLDKSAYQSQVIPIMFFIDICMVTQSPTYAQALADYIINNAKQQVPYMEVTILDTYIDTETSTSVTDSPDQNGNSSTTTSPTTAAPQSTSTESATSSIMATKVNSLLYKAEQKYITKKKVDGPTTNNWTNNGKQYSSTTTITTYTFENQGTVQSTIYDTKDKDTNPFYKMTAQTYQNPFNGLNTDGYYRITNGASWLFKFMDDDSTLADNKNTSILKYILYKWTGTSYGVTQIDSSWFNLDMFNDILGGLISVNDTTISRDDFIKKVQSYLIGPQYANFTQNAGVIYDTCKRMNINPVLCAAQGLQEQGWKMPSTSPWNYWGIAVYNGQNYGTAFSNMEDGVTGYCNIILSDERPGSYSDNDSKKYASLNSKYTGKMQTIYDVLASYAVPNGTPNDQQKADYMVDYVNKLIQSAKQIFGEDALSDIGGDLLQVASQLHDNEKTWNYSTGGDLYWGNIKESINNPNKVTCCATYVSCILYQSGYLTEQQTNSFNYNSAMSLYGFLKNRGWQEITEYSQLKAGDIVFCSDFGHVQLYAGGNKWFNAGANDAIHGTAPEDQGSWGSDNFTTALRPPTKQM